MRRRPHILALATCLIVLAVGPRSRAQQAKTTPAAPAPAAQAPAAKKPAVLPQVPLAHFVATRNTVLVNFEARDASGKLVRDLKPNDITLYEDGKPQHIDSMELQDVDQGVKFATATSGAVPPGPEGVVVNGTPPAKAATAPAATSPAGPNTVSSTGAIAQEAYPDKRLLVIYLDLTTMQPEDVESAVDSAQDYIKKKMSPADLIAVASLGNDLDVNLDFTADKEQLLRTLDDLNPLTSAGFADGGDGTTDSTPDDGNTYAVDDTEFNIANADRSLEAMQSLCDMLSPINQKKSVLVFTSGIQRSGVDNELTLRSAVNSCVKANAALYTVDARGLQANVPGGPANTASLRGSANFNGRAVLNALDTQFAQQETLATLANDTGGEAFLDSNDFAPAYAKIVADTQAFYLISYSSTNQAQDGKYRKITIKVDRPDLKLNYRPGYYGPKDFAHLSADDRTQQIEDELDSPTPEESLDLYASDAYLKLSPTRYFVPVAVAIPGGEIPTSGLDEKKGTEPSVTLVGIVRDQLGRPIDHVQQNIRLNPVTGPGGKLQQTNIQYETGFVLSPGQKYNIRFAARENQTGQMGAFETVIEVPDLDALAAKAPSDLEMSPVLVGSQLVPARPDPQDPLTADGTALVSDVTHVFAAGQHMYLYYEVYNAKENATGGIDLKTNVAFYRGRIRTYETSLVSHTTLTDPRRHTAVVQLDVPLAQLPPGYYTVQVNVIDQAAQRYAFPRLPILIRAAAPAVASPPSSH